MSAAALAKVPFIFNKSVKRQQILDLMIGIVPPETLNIIQPDRVVYVWNNALLAKRRPDLEKVGSFVDSDEISSMEGGRRGGRRSHSKQGQHRAPGAGKDVYGGRDPKSRGEWCQAFIANGDMTTRTWQAIIKLIERHDVARNRHSLRRLKPGDPIALRDGQLPKPLVQTLMAHGKLEHQLV